MKKILLILFILAACYSCAKYEDFPMRPVSFEINGIKYYSAKDMGLMQGSLFQIPEPDTLRVLEYGDTISITYSRSSFLQHTMNKISLDLLGLCATFETGTKIHFDESDELQEYPVVYMHPVMSTSATEYDLYKAQQGWIEFYEINWDEKYISGRFEFTAVLQEPLDCDHDKVIEVKKGSFENIPFSFNYKYNQDRL